MPDPGARATGERFGVIGAGIVGLAVARRLQQVFPGAPVTVLDKEDRVAAHQTGHNSGVVHAGLYYAPGSLKATLCRRGLAMLREYCAEKHLPYREVGKLVVARSQDELPALGRIEERALANAVPGLRRLGPGGICDVEPRATGVAALYSPRTAITDFVAVAESYARDIVDAGGSVRLGFDVRAVRPDGDRVTVANGRSRRAGTGEGQEELTFDRLVICAGLHADRVAGLAGDTRDPAIVPFRGEYLTLVPERRDLVRGLIYPVPDPAYPFLGVHFTRRVDGRVDLGPNAVLALATEGYRRRDVSLRDVGRVLARPGFRRLAARHWQTGLGEFAGSASRALFIRRARDYVPGLTVADVRPAPAGVRAQAVAADGSLVDDFRLSHVGRITSVRNAPSPAATSSLAIAEYLGDRIAEHLRSPV
jgi:L-2-hydroxyglutarate oxidase LhgO